MRAVVVAVIIAAIVLVVGLILLGLAGDFLVDWTWFSAVGYPGVFWTVVATKSIVFAAAFVGSAAFLAVNGSLASKLSGRARHAQPATFDWQSVRGYTLPDLLRLMPRHARWPLLVMATGGILAILIAAIEVSNWDVFLRFFYHVPYGRNDPVYGKDIGFYLFSLPAYVVLKNWLLLTLIASVLFAGAVYWLHGDLDFSQQRRSISPTAVAHGSALLGLFFAVKAWSYVLDRFLLLNGDNGVVVGASFTDVHLALPVLWLLIGLAAIAAFLSWANLRVRTYKLPLAAAVLVFGTSFVLAEVLPAMFQRVYVRPNELQLEKPYIQSNIALTQEAYNLHQVTVKSFPAEQNLTVETLESNQATIGNIRLWDWQPLMDTYAQLQEIRTYYRFHDVDVDRYWLDGVYQQVMLSARELKSALLPANAQTWVNRHVLFTHGNGVIMSPVTRKSGEGLPIFYLQNIPPAATGGPPIEEPRIYYGEETDTYVIVKGSTPEFDYPNGKDNVYATYEGTGGVAVGGIARRVLFAWYFEDLNILISDYITDASRIMFRRTIQDRVRTIAPFLRLDHDPYIVVADGRIFPELFKPLAAMPQALQKHIRYPEDLFLIQAQMYRAYHMDSPEVFYNREDLWQFPRQPGGETATMVPYYIIMRLPGEPQAELFLMLPMAPAQRQNMIAWLAARCDPPYYGELIVYDFPKDKLVFGPFQIEARINQDTEISRQLSLWNQLGSRVIRGHLIVIPIENSILYVSPLYLRAETGQLPELKRVIAAYGDRVVMEETLAQALAALFRGPASAAPGAPARPSAAGAEADRAREALGHYDRAMEQLKAGDWGGFGAELEKLRSLLEES